MSLERAKLPPDVNRLATLNEGKLTVRRRWILHVAGFLVVATLIQLAGSGSVAVYSGWCCLRQRPAFAIIHRRRRRAR